MNLSRNRPSLGVLVYFSLASVLAAYFTVASVQGDFGMFRRIQIESEVALLRAELAQLEKDLAVWENKTRRMSDAYLDLELLDEQIRNVLGMARADEIILY